jgi:hypothetical protein
MMVALESEVKNCEIEVRAGIGRENSDVYAWVNSPIPDWAKTVDDPVYRLYAGNTLEIAKKIVRETGRDITLRLSVDYRP